MTPNANRDQAIQDRLVQQQMQPSHSFELGGHTYSCLPLMPLEEIHLARRLAPLVVGALKPEEGRVVILQQLAKATGLGASDQAADIGSARFAEAAMDLAVAVLEAASAVDEEAVNDILRKVMSKVMRKTESGGMLPCWHKALDRPGLPDIDGFLMLGIAGNYLAGAFKGRIASYIATLDLKPGPALAQAMGAAGGSARPPHAPAAPASRKPGEPWKPPTREEVSAGARG